MCVCVCARDWDKTPEEREQILGEHGIQCDVWVSVFVCVCMCVCVCVRLEVREEGRRKERRFGLGYNYASNVFECGAR